MIKIVKTIAIIPARGGSKGVKLKNIRDICGKPLIYYQLKNALDSPSIDKVVLASDSDKILKVSANLFGSKITMIKRPPEISMDNSKTEETLLYVLNQLPESFDIVVTLEPTNPLNRVGYIEKCINLLKSGFYSSHYQSTFDAVCCGIEDFSFSLTGSYIKQRPMRNEITPKIRECGNCWVTRVDELRRTKNRLGKTFEFIIIPKKDSYHLDSEDDWIIIEAMMKQRLLKESGRYYRTRGIRTNKDLYDVRYWKKIIDPDGNCRDKTEERLKRVNSCQEEIDYINNLKPGRILDVGCGLGFLLSTINSNWKKHGVEISEYGAEYAKRYGKILCGVLQAAKYESNYFDAILFYHVIEHMENPIDELIEIRRILKPGGKLIIGTPDFDCGLAKRFGFNFRLLKDETHISLFNTFGLFRLLTDLFFEVESISYPFFKTEYFTKDNLLRLFDASKVSPPFYGNVMTFYTHKK